MTANSPRRVLKRSSYRLLAVVLILTACSSPAARPTPAPVEKPARPATAELTVQAEPPGAQVTVDGQPAGVSPITLPLAPGDHRVALRAEGYAALEETITLQAGQQGIYSPALWDVAAPVVTLTAEPREVAWLGQTQVRVAASDNAGVVEIQLVLDGQLLGSAGGGELALELTPAAVPGLAPGGAYTLTARAADAAGNAGQVSLPLIVGPLPKPTIAPAAATATPSRPAATASPAISPTPLRPTAIPLPPTATPAASPAPTVVAAPAVSYRVTEIVIPTYPYTPFLRSAIDPAAGEFPLTVLDRAAYEASNPQPIPVTYRLIVLENRYLRLSLLPDLGGRVYECIFKPTGNNEFYRNPVIKPTNWGPPSPPYPAGANWWLAAGGLEWGFPVEEHGYLWSTRWGYDPVTNPDGSVTVMLFTGDFTRPYVAVAVTLPADAAYFTVSPAITNPNAAAFRFQWWANAMLAPGAANAPGPDLRFIFPASEMTVHSTGDPTLPAAGQPLPWPIYRGRDLGRLGNWNQWLGFFQRPAAVGGFVGVYDTAADEGMVRVYPADVTRGAMVFAPGWSDPLDAKLWTDDGSGFVALRGGMTPTVEDWYELAPGAEISWSEIWYPVAGISGVTYAAESGAIHLLPGGSGLRVGVFPTVAVQGQITVSLPGMEPVRWPVAVGPDKPFNQQIPYTANMPDRGNVAVTLTDSEDLVVLTYQTEVPLR
ncbi:MAG: DUF5107 domain-containing protein [Chloroflexi bacterium]|nr:DUF5107 domain-containing protein [Chloroflexota bacterium]